MPSGLMIRITRHNVEGGGFLKLDQSGKFEFKALPAGPISIAVDPWQRVPPGYRVSAKNKCRNPIIGECLEGQLERDITDLTILLEPGEEARRAQFDEIDPAILADFNDARGRADHGGATGDSAVKHALQHYHESDFSFFITNINCFSLVLNSLGTSPVGRA